MQLKYNTSPVPLFLPLTIPGALHVPLNVAAKEVTERIGGKTAQMYLHAVLPFFTWLKTDE
jgi:hypothetical protein